MQTPGFNKKATDACGLLPQSSQAPSPASKALPPLAVLTIRDSAFLRRFYRCFYCLFAVALIIALGPYLSDERSSAITRLIWCCATLLGCIGLWCVCQRQCRAIPAGSLAYENGLWVLRDKNKLMNYVLAGDVLCWPWLIILPLKTMDGCSRLLLLGADALEPADQARLRTWLRACLKPKG